MLIQALGGSSIVTGSSSSSSILQMIFMDKGFLVIR
jgi:hypothetical protein